MWEYNNASTDELMHYGVLGMKWGVRRYQKYDGSYTKRGLARYKKDEEAYNKAKESAKRIKESYKSGAATKEQYKTAKSQVKINRKQLNKSYKNLKTDNLADKGKELYKKGKTISGNLYINKLGQSGIMLGMAAAAAILNKTMTNRSVAYIASATISAGATAASLILAGKTISDNKKLRAYYGH